MIEREWEGGAVSDRERENGRVEGSVIERECRDRQRERERGGGGGY